MFFSFSDTEWVYSFSRRIQTLLKHLIHPLGTTKLDFSTQQYKGNSGVIKLDFFPSARKRSNGGRCSTVRERGKHMSCIAMS